MRYKYTDDDIEFLKVHYPKLEWGVIFERFSNLTKTSIIRKCAKLGIKAKEEYRHSYKIDYTKFTEQEINYIKNNYNLVDLDTICSVVNTKKKFEIVGLAKKLGLKSFNAIETNVWKSDEIDYLIDNWKLVPDEIMAKHLGRTFRAVKWKREELGLYRVDFESNTYPTLSKYIRGNIQYWKKDSMEKCNYKCVLTGSKEFQIHHLYGVSQIIDDILNKYEEYKGKEFSEYTDDDLSFLLDKFKEEQDKHPLGECIRKDLHVLFHKMYGQYYNTPEQWYRFKDDYMKGVYKDYV